MAYLTDDVVADSSVSLRRWLFPAFALSLLVHGGLFYGLSHSVMENLSATDKPRLVPRVFSVNRLKVDENLLQPEAKKSGTPAAPNATPTLLSKISEFDGTFEQDIQELRAAPQVNTPQAPDLKEKPTVDTKSTENATAKAKNESALALEKELSEVRQKLANDKPTVSNRPKISGNLNNPSKTNGEESGQGDLPENSAIPKGFSNLDDLLTGSARVGNGTAPILMPTDLLFDYDSADLRAGATASLQKLGRLIQRNPQATFKVEGHTDSFGSDEYNMGLSQRRADTVKDWLVQNMNIDAGRITTQGYGKTRLIVPGDRSVEEQQLNRRVEIVIHAK
jgi:outer membrane protein OmpA-like peptidoglycan-associated protein